MGIWKDDQEDVDAVLRAARATPREELVTDLSSRVLNAPRPASGRPHRGSRVAFALALSVLMLGTFASFGGAGYAATTASEKQTAAGVQYGEESVPSTTTPSTTVKVAGASTSAQPKDTLPFTGYGLGGTALVGSLLLALGVFLRRREARE